MTKLYTTILCAADLSEGADAVVQHALDLAEAQGAKLVLLHVLPEMEASMAHHLVAVMGQERFAAYARDHEKNVRQQLEERLDGLQVGRGLDMSVEVQHGSPSEEILSAAERVKADLVVLGRHAKGSMRHALLGSVAERVVRQADRPVLVVPPPA